jgi:hypothetical protein
MAIIRTVEQEWTHALGTQRMRQLRELLTELGQITS